jgi:SOS-response transcriptional repressor LexA
MSDHPKSQSDPDETLASSVEASGIDSDHAADRLVEMLGVRALQGLDPDAASNASFYDWWARELRTRTSADAQSVDAASFESRMRTRLAVREHRVQIVDEPPERRRPPSEGTVAQLLGEAGAQHCVPDLHLGVAAGAGRDLWDEPCTSWIELPPDVPAGEHVALTVSGNSMEPLLHAGDTILVKLGSELRRGSVVVARRPEDGYVVKRVARVGARLVELASFNAGYPPIRIPRRDDLILGTVLMCWRAKPA